MTTISTELQASRALEQFKTQNGIETLSVAQEGVLIGILSRYFRNEQDITTNSNTALDGGGDNSSELNAGDVDAVIEIFATRPALARNFANFVSNLQN
jgi:hypothetical protein